MCRFRYWFGVVSPFSNILRVVLPTFLVMYAFAGGAFNVEPRHRQVFGDKNYFMELWFDGNPALPRQSLIPYLRFQGELISDKTTRKVTGYLARRMGKPTYHLRVGHEIWEGALKTVPDSCDGFLEISDLRTGRAVSPARLKAGFCADI